MSNEQKLSAKHEFSVYYKCLIIVNQVVFLQELVPKGQALVPAEILRGSRLTVGGYLRSTSVLNGKARAVRHSSPK